MSDTDKVCDKAYDKAIENLIDIHVALDECRFAQNELPDFRVDTVRLPSVRDDVVLFRISATNLGSEPVRPTAIDLKIDGDAVPGIEADAWRFYKEGLTVVGVAGSRRSGDCDFELDPNFLPLTVSDPAAYRWDRPGRFLAEQVGVVQDERTGEALLAGLVTSTVALGRIALDAGAPEGASLRIVLDVAGLQIPPGETVVLETLMLARGRDVERLLEDYADELGARMGALNAGRVPRGWCSYYQYYGHETEDDILENARFLAAHREDLPAEVIQIDDGWQAARGHWLESHAGKFPHGMAWLAARRKPPRRRCPCPTPGSTTIPNCWRPSTVTTRRRLWRTSMTTATPPGRSTWPAPIPRMRIRCCAAPCSSKVASSEFSGSPTLAMRASTRSRARPRLTMPPGDPPTAPRASSESAWRCRNNTLLTFHRSRTAETTRRLDPQRSVRLPGSKESG